MNTKPRWPLLWPPILLLVLLTLAPLRIAAQAAPPPRPACTPLVNGYPVGLPTEAAGALGRHLYWKCRLPKTDELYFYGFSCPHTLCSPDKLGEAIHAITRASARVGVLGALWDANVEFHCPLVLTEQTTRGALCRERLQILKANAREWLK